MIEGFLLSLPEPGFIFVGQKYSAFIQFLQNELWEHFSEIFVKEH
jgi:hypothetical protein